MSSVNPLPPTPPAIEVDALAKTYGEVDAVRSVSFTVGRGEVFGFLGPNGAGERAHVGDIVATRRNDRQMTTDSGEPARNR